MLITTIGSIARQVMDQRVEMTILGVTSRGAFLRAGPSWVLFLSLEPYRGPLTMNMPKCSDVLRSMEPGDVVRVEDNRILFPKNRLELSTREAVMWLPERPAHPVLAPGAIRSRLEVISRQVLTEPAAFAAEDVDALRAGLWGDRARETTSAAIRLLGRGSGLTPSGDDLAVGLLLALNRWRICFPPNLPVEQINQQVRQAADQKTTTLSANLIRCAAQGLADERLIQALDGLVTGDPNAETCVSLLRGWGHHSGCDAFVGMAAALEARSEENVG